MMRGFRFVFRTRRTDQPGNDAVHGDAVRGQVIRKRAGEPDNPSLRRHHMGTVLRAGMRAQPSDIDDGPRPAFPQSWKTGLRAVKRAIEGDVEDFAPFGVVHLGEGFFPPQRRIVDEDIDAAEMVERRVRESLTLLRISNIANYAEGSATGCTDLKDKCIDLASIRTCVDNDR